MQSNVAHNSWNAWTDNDTAQLHISSGDHPLNRFELPSYAFARAYVDYFYSQDNSASLTQLGWSDQGTIACYRCAVYQMWGHDVQIEQRPGDGFVLTPGLPDQQPFQCQRCGDWVWNFRIHW